jgi:hypothetical protein
MSPEEYHAITAALYSSNWGAAAADFKKQQRPHFEELKVSLERQLEDLEEGAMREALEEQLETVRTQLAKLPADQGPTAAEEVHRANQQLYKKYEKTIEGSAAKGLDVLLLSAGQSSAWEDAFRVGDED